MSILNREGGDGVSVVGEVEIEGNGDEPKESQFCDAFLVPAP